MEKGIEYLVIPKRSNGEPEVDAVGVIKDGYWYDLGRSSPTTRFDPGGRAQIMAGCWAKVDGMTLIRESDGEQFALIPKG